jgi:hypothetical protein
MNTKMPKNTSQAIWNWKSSDRNTKSAAARPPLTGPFIGLAVGATVAALFYYFGHFIMTAVVAVISLSLFSCAVFYPRGYRVIQVFLQKFSFLVGQTLTWVLLMPFFYLGFSFGRLMQKMTGKDPMTRDLNQDSNSYWVAHQPVSDKEQYKRLF